MIYAQPRICPREWYVQTTIGFWNTNGSPNLGQTTRSHHNRQKKGNLENCELCSPGKPQSENKRMWKEGQVPGPSSGTEKAVEQESDDNTNCDCCSWYRHQRISTRTGRLGNKRTSGDDPNYCIIKIGQNSEKISGDLRRLVVSQTPVKKHQLMLVRKTLKRDDLLGDVQEI